MEFSWEILNGPWLVYFEGILVIKCEVLVRRSVNGCLLVKRTYMGLLNVLIRDLLGLTDSRMLRDVGTKVAGE